MKIIVISKYAVIREGIAVIISKHKNSRIQYVGENLKEALLMIKVKAAEVVLLDINEENEEDLKLISEIKALGTNIKVMVLDYFGSHHCFIEALKSGAEGYIIGKSNEEEILYALEQLEKGKKYFDSTFVDYMVNASSEPQNKLELLTFREKEILIEVSQGLTNKDIAQKFCITEHTVKKHIGHIFHKLNISYRTEAVRYVKGLKMV